MPNILSDYVEKESFIAEAAIHIAAAWCNDRDCPSPDRVAAVAYNQAEYLWIEHCKRFPKQPTNPQR